ncbi:MAG: S41 family peptidase [Tannerella sp.]|jgi:carboxyl-terminal processing protease|nr:S41 family peptidase [Tannerella sp.]
MNLKNRFFLTLLLFCALYGTVFAQEEEEDFSEEEEQISVSVESPDSNRFEVSKQLDIINAIVKEMEMFYVDRIDIQRTVKRGIDAMLKSLDPYTEYIPESEMEGFQFLTTGEYGGIGAYIKYRNGGTVITEPFEKMPAAEAGMKAGDVIISIDTVDTKGLTSDRVSELLKGVPNTKMTVKVQRPGEKKPRTFNIIRRKIVVDQVVYYGVYGENTGYINLVGFKENSAQEIRSAYDDLKNNHNIKSLILDLRDNGGGLLESAVQIVNFFVPKGEEVISLKGKSSHRDRIYRTYKEPIDTIIPLAVLINGSSASASEIVAGALQDMDRAILIGQRSFGKGLVQSTRDLPYEGKLKVTMSKYYIPSGRCIQQMDYSHRNPDGSVAAIPDSLTTVFYTRNGRPVRDGGGIRPDFEVADEKMPTMMYYLYTDRDYIIFDYVTDWVSKHKTIPGIDDFEYSDADYEQFKKYIKDKNFEYDRQSVVALSALKEIADIEGFVEQNDDLFASLEERLKPNLDNDLVRYEKEIRRLISAEIIKRYYYQRGEVQQNLKGDETLQKAINVLKNSEEYLAALKKTQ